MKFSAQIALTALLLGVAGTAFAAGDPVYDSVLPISETMAGEPAVDDPAYNSAVPIPQRPGDEPLAESLDLEGCGCSAGGCCDDGCTECCGRCDPCGTVWQNMRLSTTIDSFKGPMDLDNRNGNFGINFAVNAGFPAIDRLGVGMQVGTNAILSDFHGTYYTGATMRSQNFTTLGMFQRRTTATGRDWKWGLAYDFLYDKYYTTFKMGQWRAKLGYELNPYQEVGMWICAPGFGDYAPLGGGAVDYFKPVGQYQFYYRRCWPNDADTMVYVGAVENPGQAAVGSRVRMPLTGRASIIANFNYVLARSGGITGQDQEMWNVAMGIEIIPGWGGNRCRDFRYTPLLPLADNSIFAIRRY